MAELFGLIDKLAAGKILTHGELVTLIDERTPDTAAYLAEKAVAVRKAMYGNAVYIRGLIEVSNICKNDCLYCGIRAGNPHCDRYRLTEEDILSACAEGKRLVYRRKDRAGRKDKSRLRQNSKPRMRKTGIKLKGS